MNVEEKKVKLTMAESLVVFMKERSRKLREIIS